MDIWQTEPQHVWSFEALGQSDDPMTERCLARNEGTDPKESIVGLLKHADQIKANHMSCQTWMSYDELISSNVAMC